MHMLNPRIVIEPCGWWGKFLGFEYKGHLLYAVEAIHRDVRWAEEMTEFRFRAKDKSTALRHAARIKSSIKGSVSELYPFDWDEDE
jgi:hypothetical protein